MYLQQAFELVLNEMDTVWYSTFKKFRSYTVKATYFHSDCNGGGVLILGKIWETSYENRFSSVKPS